MKLTTKKELIKLSLFLIFRGFTIKKYERNGDIELNYKKKKLQIEIAVFSLANFQYSVSMVFNVNGLRINSLDYWKIGEKEVEELCSLVATHQNSYSEQISDYSRFIIKNFHSIKTLTKQLKP